MLIPDPSRQVAFHQLLVAARKTWLSDALAAALDSVGVRAVKRELDLLIPTDVQRILARAGIRDEYVFPCPSVLEAAPTLLGYYRLLLGASQKAFYGSGRGLGRFKKLETHGALPERLRAEIPELCSVFADPLAELVRQISPRVTSRDVAELPLLTLGSQFQGANNNTIGRQATLEVFLAIAEVVETHVVRRAETELEVENASGRTVLISLAADPDVRIDESFGDEIHRQVAIEIKGGTDKSNVHNRAGEAEKSHQKAKAAGYREFWTIIALTGLDRATLRSESPTTQSWFDAAHVLGRTGEDWETFRSRLAGKVGIPVSN